MSRKNRVSRLYSAVWVGLVVFVAGCSPATGPQARENAVLHLDVHAATLVMLAEDALHADQDMRQDLADEMAQLEHALARIRAAGGDAEADRLAPLVKRAGENVARLREQQPQLIGARAAARSAIAAVPPLSAALDEVMRAMSADHAPMEQMILVNRQVVLAERMARHLAEVLAGGELQAAVAGVDAVSRDEAVFARVLESLDQGGPDFGIARIESASGRAALAKVVALHATFQADLAVALQDSTALLEEQGDVEDLRELYGDMLDAGRTR